MRFHLRLIPAALLLSVLFLNGSATSAPTKSSVAAHAGVGKIIKELHQTHKLLEEADHDYDGHRAKAMHEIHEAVHALMAHMGNGENKPAEKKEKPAEKPAKPAEKPAGGTGMKETQAASDAQLKEALANLQKIEPQLGSVKSEHATKAEKAVAAAIGELKIALSIK